MICYTTTVSADRKGKGKGFRYERDKERKNTTCEMKMQKKKNLPLFGFNGSLHSQSHKRNECCKSDQIPLIPEKEESQKWDSTNGIFLQGNSLHEKLEGTSRIRFSKVKTEQRRIFKERVKRAHSPAHSKCKVY
jgi:hypothetical protein